MRTWIWLPLLLGWGCASASKPPVSGPESSSAQAQPAVASANAAPLISIPNAKEPLTGVVTGGPPSEAHLREAQASGYRTVVSLLPESESAAEAATVAELGLRFVSIPVASAADLSVDNAHRLGAALSEDNKPLILHCGSGNRVGALLALWAFHVDGRTKEQALALGDSAGLAGLRPEVEQRLGTSAGPSPAP